ncbi:Chromosome partition protein Smc [Phycisphaerae bacterium RAS1]|nr:Chromosome partition protein Smc [Phycisphaerae bacterium RAS1]
MFLRRVTLHGFKSFADRTEFDFGPGITSIVGPNGCGKSNILDAVRWVLGEQSAKSLRGSCMEDVIFSGSRSRKPAAAAEVILAFDNRSRILACDEEEVSVARTLLRNGQSEYRLNGNVSRLKDVRALFLDTGVGTDAYSVIAQGRVDLLIQASPVERREIFEEAAGISRYKARREEAERKLERTRINLQRLVDVIDELEKRLRSVRLAAGKARNYRDYDSRLRELRSMFSLAEYHALLQARAEAAAKADELRTAITGRRTELGQCDALAAEEERRLQTLDEQIQSAEAAIAELQAHISALSERLAQGERRLGELDALRDRRRKQLADCEGKFAAMQARLSDERGALCELSAASDQAAAAARHSQQAREQAAAACQSARGQLEGARAAAFDAVRRAALLTNQHEQLERERTRLAAESQRYDARLAQIADERGALAARRSVVADRMQGLEETTRQTSARIRALESQLESLGTQLRAADEEIGHWRDSRTAAQSRLTVLEDMERRFEGIDQAARTVLAWRGEIPSAGVVGLVADVLRIDDPRLPILGPILATFEKDLVVRDTYAFFAELGKHAALPGGVGVVTLDRIQPAPPRSYVDAPGFVACAADWVTTDSEFRDLAAALLGRTIVVDVLERALALAGEAPEGYVFVTLDGDAIGANGRILVGGAAAAPGLFTRRAEIRQHQREIEQIEASLVHAQRARSELAATASDVHLQRDSALAEIAAAQRDTSEARSTLARIDDELARAERESGGLDSELASLGRTLSELGAQFEALRTQLAEARGVQESHESQAAALAAELERLDALLAGASAAHTQTLVEAGRLSEKRSAAEAAAAALETSLKTLLSEQGSAERDAAESLRQIDAARSELLDARQRREACIPACEQKQAEALELRTERQAVRERIEQCGAAARELHRQIEATDEELRGCEVSLREIEVRADGLAVRVRDELGVDLAAQVATYQHSEQDWEAIRGEIEELRGKISRLGNVNLDAIAELEELTPRYENLIAQRDDLNSSVERLDALIRELDAESTARFSAAFAEIRENFRDMFRRLFGGGKADVILEDPEKPLECGIEIIARPPGKEPQSISLLSGGEKTMTAVALIMAVFKSKPSPFAILDEVDAALDEANVDRFNGVLTEFLARTQFVVITHSKRTMQHADVLYGITMEEPGVSKRVSVRFDDRVSTPTLA